MPKSASSETRLFALALAGIALVTAWRVALLPFDRADLFVDDAQYWLWGRELAWGYYSKPPLIAWIVRLSTEIGSDARFWIRLPLPLIHAGTAVVVALIGRRLFGPRVGAIAGVGYVSLPGVAVASLLVSTDTPLLFCFALAMLAQLHLGARRSPAWAVVLGAAVGFGLLAKYAMIYFPLMAAIAALVAPMARIDRRDAGVAVLVALAIFAPNVIWNASNQFATLHHTADNADWDGIWFDLEDLLEFAGGQFAVAGPVVFAAFVVGLARIAQPTVRYLAAMSLPVFTMVGLQAMLSDSSTNANWAAAGHLAALVLAAAVLAGRPRWLAIGLGINLFVTAALPVAAVVADSWRIGSGNLVLRRYVGQSAVSLRAADIAGAEGLDTIVSGNRAILADLFYTLRDTGLHIYAKPVEGFPPNHYAQKHPLPPGKGDVLFITRSSDPPACRSADVMPREVSTWQPALGFVTDEIHAFRVPRMCWFAPAS